jgi:hypothetical protein
MKSSTNLKLFYSTVLSPLTSLSPVFTSNGNPESDQGRSNRLFSENQICRFFFVTSIGMHHTTPHNATFTKSCRFQFKLEDMVDPKPVELELLIANQSYKSGS